MLKSFIKLIQILNLFDLFYINLYLNHITFTKYNIQENQLN